MASPPGTQTIVSCIRFYFLKWPQISFISAIFELSRPESLVERSPPHCWGLAIGIVGASAPLVLWVWVLQGEGRKADVLAVHTADTLWMMTNVRTGASAADLSCSRLCTSSVFHRTATLWRRHCPHSLLLGSTLRLQGHGDAYPSHLVWEGQRFSVLCCLLRLEKNLSLKRSSHKLTFT